MGTAKNKFHMNIYPIVCGGLPTTPDRSMGTVLVTGASGYIGGRLVPELLAREYKVRAMVRGVPGEYSARWPNIEIVEADALEKESLAAALDGIDTAYYLLHSLHLGPKNFEKADLQAAKNFWEVAEQKGVKRIIYLGGVGDTSRELSSHLRSRIEVAHELKKGSVPVTILRAAVIIGSGSASYEIIHHLVKRSPVIFVPSWLNNKCHPISVRDVLKYLVGVLEIPETQGKSFDLRGKETMTYLRMIKLFALVLNKKILFVPSIISNIGFISYVTSLITPVPEAITRCLMEGLRNEALAGENSIKEYLPFEPLPFKEAVVRAMTREEQDQVRTRWSDAYPPAYELSIKLQEIKNGPAYSVKYSKFSKKTAVSLFNCLCNVGGDEGWFHNNWMWRLRGKFDRLLLGVGSQRGRRSDTNLNINDVIDFWRVEDLQPNTRLLLRAEMKLPGKAWLEFCVKPKNELRELSVAAYFETHSLFGRAYWYFFTPFHHIIFWRLIDDIERRS